MGRFSAWLRQNSEEQLLAATQTDLARRYLDREGPIGRPPPPGAFFWQRVFVPVYRRLPWRLRRFVIHRLPGSHRRRWGSRTPP